MNKEHTFQLIQQRFVNLTDSATDVVRAERRHNGTPLGIFYFDFSESVAAEGFDLRSYMQQQIATDFYKHEGALQWNYYFYFVLDRTTLSKLRETSRVAEIEGDRMYARKFLRDPETLDAELAQPLATILHSTAPSQDIASRWVVELKSAGLERIADPAADYAPTIREYLAGAVAKPHGIRPTQGLPVANGCFIQSLRLDQFRTHPVEKNFTFGKVNLIRGVNGTGKTSLLEAIELCICGGNRRQRGEHPNGARLQIQFEGQARLQRCPESNAANYRARDLAWYGGYYLQGNRLFDNFGRFNFFDSDAAYLLSSATNGEMILKAITNLLLGEYATTIEERMGQCKERFTREYRELSKLMQIRRKELVKATEELNQIKAIKDTRDALISELQAKAEATGWKKTPARPKLDDLALLEEAVEDWKERFKQDTARLAWMARISVAILRRKSEQLAEAVKKIAGYRESLEKNTTALEKDRERIETLGAEVKILTRLKQYHDEAEAMTLVGTEDTIAATRTKVACYKEAMGLVRGLNLKLFEQFTLPLEEIADQLTADIAKHRRILTKLRNRTSELQAQLGAIKAVVEEIKGLGARFCEVNPSGKICPLCGTAHDDLRKRIAALSIGPAIESPLGELTTEIAREQAIVDELQKAMATLAQLRQAAQLLFTANQLSGRSAKVVVETLSEIGEKLAIEKTNLDSLIAKEKRLKLAGFSENELSGLLDDAVKKYGLLRTKLDKADGVQALLADRTKSLDVVRDAVKEKEKHEKETLVEIRRLILSHLGDGGVGDPDIELERRSATVDEVLASALESKNPFVLAEVDEFSAIQAKLATFTQVVRRIHEALKRVEEKDALEQRLTFSLTEAQRELASLEPKHKRAATAVAILEKLLSSDYKATYLNKVIADHKQRLATIFSRIHAPHEFKDVHLSEDMLLERNTGAKSPVCEISTGQRAALALSIFLSLNSSVTARAPWLIFDDPVAYVDDMNVLSFLDMLRDLVLLGDRQVFFATANSRIADLFAKKFDCLGKDFKEICLQR